MELFLHSEYIFITQLITEKKLAFIFYSVFFHIDVTHGHAFKSRSSNEGEWIKALRSIFGLVKEQVAEGLESHVIWNFTISFI
jgi:hypothetical protein